MIRKIILTILTAVSVHAGYAQHVILISIDGLRPDMYLDKSWPTPNLQDLMKGGVYAGHMRSVFPAYTYPSHTAMLTGALPGRSGIFFNQPRNSKGEWNWFTKDIKTKTLWQALNEKGMATAAVEWPVSVSNDISFNIPEIWDIKKPEDRITETRKYATRGLVEEMEQNITGKLDSINMSEDNFSLDINSAKMAAYIFTNRKPSLLAVHFALVDGMEHEHGLLHDSVRLAVKNADSAIGIIRQAVMNSGMKDSTVIIIVGDHGFADIKEAFRPNMLIQDLPARFIAAGGSAFLYSQRNIDKGSIALLLKQVKERLEQLPEGKRKQFAIIDRKQLDEMGADSAALMALSADPNTGLVFSGAVKKAANVNNGPGTAIQQNPLDGVFVPVTGGHHGYNPNTKAMYTGFIAAGAGIKKQSSIKDLCVTDIAPLIAALLHIDFPCPDGKLVGGILER